MIKGEIEYILSTPIKYGHTDSKTGGKGTDEEAISVILYAPSVNQMKHAGKLKQFVMQAMGQGSKASSEGKTTASNTEKEVEVTGDDFVMMLTSSDVDYVEAMESFNALLCSGAGKLEGKQNLTSLLIDKLAFNDLEGMLGKYLESFLLQSLIQKMKEEK
jgi:hypothetical protein